MRRRVEGYDAPRLAPMARAAANAGDQRIHVFVTGLAVPLSGWLPVDPHTLFPEREAGVVGPRILADAGALEEAGGMVGVDGARQRRGRGDPNPDRPEYRYVRRVDFCSPPILATRRERSNDSAGSTSGRRAGGRRCRLLAARGSGRHARLLPAAGAGSHDGERSRMTDGERWSSPRGCPSSTGRAGCSGSGT